MFAAAHGLWELTIFGVGRLEWFLLESEEAEAFRGLINELDPELSTLCVADVCGLVRAVTGTPPDRSAPWQP